MCIVSGLMCRVLCSLPNALYWPFGRFHSCVCEDRRNVFVLLKQRVNYLYQGAVKIIKDCFIKADEDTLFMPMQTADLAHHSPLPAAFRTSSSSRPQHLHSLRWLLLFYIFIVNTLHELLCDYSNETYEKSVYATHQGIFLQVYKVYKVEKTARNNVCTCRVKA